MKTLFLFAALLAPQDTLEKIEDDLARAIGTKLVEEAAAIEKPRLKIEADAAKSVGLHDPGKKGFMVVPQKDLKEGGEGYEAKDGKPLGYLFLYKMVPLLDGKAIETDTLHSIALKGDDGQSIPVHVLLLSVKKAADDDWRLLALGPGEKPVFDVKFAGGKGPGGEPVAVESKEVDGKKTLVLTLFDKYQATLPLQAAKE